MSLYFLKEIKMIMATLLADFGVAGMVLSENIQNHFLLIHARSIKFIILTYCNNLKIIKTAVPKTCNQVAVYNSIEF